LVGTFKDLTVAESLSYKGDLACSEEDRLNLLNFVDDVKMLIDQKHPVVGKCTCTVDRFQSPSLLNLLRHRQGKDEDGALGFLRMLFLNHNNCITHAPRYMLSYIKSTSGYIPH
jgi:hypothetical protein